MSQVDEEAWGAPLITGYLIRLTIFTVRLKEVNMLFLKS